MKKLILLVFLLPMFSYAQDLPDFGFDRIRIADQEKIIQAELLPISSEPAKFADRLYYWCSADLIHVTQGSYSGTLLNGSYNEYYLNKSLKEQGQFKKGLKDGIWRRWNEQGSLTEIYTWKLGLRSGKYELFDEQGKLRQSGSYDHDQLIVHKDSSSFWRKFDIFKKKKKS